MDNNLIKITGLWINQSKDGGQYLSGSWGPTLRVIVFKNKNKRPDSQDPDYNLFLAPVQTQPKEKSVQDNADF